MPMSRRKARLDCARPLSAAKIPVIEVEDFTRLGLHRPYPAMQEVNGRSNMELVESLAVSEDAQYNPCAAASPYGYS